MTCGLLIEVCLKPCSHRQRCVSSCLKYASPSLVRPQRIVVAGGFVMWTERSREISVNARTSKAIESTDGDLSTVIRGCCRLHSRTVPTTHTQSTVVHWNYTEVSVRRLSSFETRGFTDICPERSSSSQALEQQRFFAVPRREMMRTSSKESQNTDRGNRPLHLVMGTQRLIVTREELRWLDHSSKLGHQRPVNKRTQGSVRFQGFCCRICTCLGNGSTGRTSNGSQFPSMPLINTVTNMESRFPAMQVLWLGREFYKVKHGVTSATLMAPMTLATILAIWRQIDDSRKCNPFLDISTRKGNTRENTM
ncbi:hypothetical protein AVEN_151808-1 [Araneus ventricosus]|uniref:Uncharacterized protein n=1 Tax=Araneus ventricosus TaxID=182803 RepID=A0A4Y2LUE2_ARAVE|nr:hypothetical protein AVEN_151808-1 [Araneus ventricosus]